VGDARRTRYIDPMRITPSILLAAMVACGSPAKSAEPTEPARSMSTASAAEASDASDARDPDRERIAAMMVTFEKLIVAFEPADGDCDALADRIRTFAKTEDAEAIRTMSRDKELEGIIAANKELIERDYAALKDRFMGVMRPCERDEAVEHALDVSRLFHKRRVDENGATVESEPESESESNED
jgi:hypothetical protein